jgi:TetR/AcrR family transcriptional regulator, transcriptional repressor for nem operon
MTRTNGRTKLLDAALAVIRKKGYAATSVDELCQRAGVTKGAFFHHFRSKEELAIAAARHFGDMADGLFATAPFTGLATPAERVLGYVAFRREILSGEIPDYTCLLGTLVQETYASHPGIRAACEAELLRHTAALEPDLRKALTAAGRTGAAWSPSVLSLHIQATLQGAFILAKATGSAETGQDSLDHLSRYLETILTTRTEKEPTNELR